MPSGSIIRYDGARGVVWRIKYRDATGRQVMETLGREEDGWNPKRAEEALEERRVQVRKSGFRRPELLTFRQYAERWFAEEEAKRGWEPTTVAAYVSVRRRLVDAFGSKRLAQIRPRDIADYVAFLSREGLSASVVHRDIAVLSAMFKSAKAAELVEQNPVEGAERPKLPPFKPPILTPEEVRAITRELTDRRARVLFLTLALSGIRRHEATGLQWRDIDLIDNTLRVVKSKSEAGERLIALAPALAEELWQLRRGTVFDGEDEYVFAHPESGRRLNAHWFETELRAAMKRAGIDRFPEVAYVDAGGRKRAGLRAFHDLRHASLTHAAASGAGPVVLMTKAGHSSMNTTRRYLHLAGTVFRDEEAALQGRLLGGQPSTEPSTNLSAPHPTSDDLTVRSEAESDPVDVG